MLGHAKKHGRPRSLGFGKKIDRITNNWNERKKDHRYFTYLGRYGQEHYQITAISQRYHWRKIIVQVNKLLSFLAVKNNIISGKLRITQELLRMTYQPHYCESESRGLLIAPKTISCRFPTAWEKRGQIGSSSWWGRPVLIVTHFHVSTGHSETHCCW